MRLRAPSYRFPGKSPALRVSLVVVITICAIGIYRCDEDVYEDEDEGCSAGCNIQIPKKRLVPPPVGSGPIDSGRLLRTAVLPTLDTPIPEGKNAIWQIGTPLAWKQSRRELLVDFPSPVGDPVATRLARSAASTGDVDPRSLLLAFGKADRETTDRIRRQLAKRFPGHQGMLLGEPRPGLFFSYAFLALAVPFARPYIDQASGMNFHGADGKQTLVRAFGLGGAEMGAYQKEREQVRVLFDVGRIMVPRLGRGIDRVKRPEYAVDLDRDSSPYQIVLAVIDRPTTLAQGFERVLQMESRHWEDYIRTHGEPPTGELEYNATLLVPNQDWDLHHRHRELEKDPTIQFRSRIRFRLDRYGVTLVTEESDPSLGSAPRYEFARPFLLYIRLRGAPRPCFSLWIENAELLSSLFHPVDNRLDDSLLPPEADAIRRVDVPMF